MLIANVKVEHSGKIDRQSNSIELGHNYACFQIAACFISHVYSGELNFSHNSGSLASRLLLPPSYSLSLLLEHFLLSFFPAHYS